MTIDCYIGNLKLDLSKDEQVDLNLSVSSATDISANQTEFTRSFTVPASDNNNYIFKHFYDGNITNGFDARLRVDGRIDINSIPYKYGKWKLEKAQVNSNNPYAYTVSFTGNLVDLKTKFGEDLLTTLDLSSLDHVGDFTTIKTGLEDKLFGGDVLYCLFSNKQLYYNSNPADNTNTDKLANIAYGGGTNAGVKYSELLPSVKAIKIIEAIETKYDITFSRHFFGRDEFTKLYLWLNEKSKGTFTYQKINFTTGSINTHLDGFDLTTDTWTGTQSNTHNWGFKLKVTPSNNTIPYKVVIKNFGNEVMSFDVKEGEFISEKILIPYNSTNSNPFEYTFYVACDQNITYTAHNSIYRKVFFAETVSSTQDASSANLIDIVNVSAFLPKIKVVDFMRGLFQMFKLIVINENGVAYVNTLKDYYAEGTIKDITKWVDFSSYEVGRANILNTVKFKFQDPTTILNIQFKENEVIPYGDEEAFFKDENGKLIDGTTLDIQLPFEQVIYERLKDLYTGTTTDIVYAGIFDKAVSKVAIKPHFHYAIKRNIADFFSLLNDSGAKTGLTSLNNMSHIDNYLQQNYSTTFSSEFNEWDGQLINNTLYSIHWQDFVNTLFDVRSRNFMFSAKNLPVTILTKLKLNDILKIKNDFYRIDNLTVGLLNGDAKLNLFNMFRPLEIGFSTDKKIIVVDNQAQTQTIYVNSIDYIFTGVSWLTEATRNGRVFTLDIAENSTGLIREDLITFTDNPTGNRIDVKIIQQQ